MSLEIVKALAAGTAPRVLCTVLQVKGSAPRHAGAMLLAGPEGLLLGSVGGGRGESRVLAACREPMAGPIVLEIDMQGTEAEGPAMVCGGTSRILVEPAVPAAPYRAALELLQRGERALLVKRVDTGETGVMDPSGAWAHGNLEDADPVLAAQALATGHPLLAEAEGIFFGPLSPREKLLILGGGHVGRALAALAPGLGFQVTVADDRSEFVEPGRFPAGVATLCGSFTSVAAGYAFDPSTYVVIVTRSHLCDLECVRAVLGRRYRYAGFMGSSRKTRMVLSQVAAEAFDPLKVEALCAPIGLEIGAETPEELAVAIAGELIAVRRDAGWIQARIPARKARRGTP